MTPGSFFHAPGTTMCSIFLLVYFFLASLSLLSLEADFLGAANTANNIVYKKIGITTETKQIKNTITL